MKEQNKQRSKIIQWIVGFLIGILAPLIIFFVAGYILIVIFFESIADIFGADGGWAALLISALLMGILVISIPIFLYFKIRKRWKYISLGLLAGIMVTFTIMLLIIFVRHGGIPQF